MSDERVAQKSTSDIDLDKARVEFEKALAIARSFARTAKTPIWNTDDISTRPNPTYTRYTKEEILRYMQAPSANEKALRDASIYMYDISTQYKRLIQYYALLMKWAYVVSPLEFDRQHVKEANFRKQYLKVMSMLENMNLQHELEKAMTIVLRDGILYGAVWSTNMSFYIQRINPDYCALTSINDGTWMYSVDMSRIRENRLNLYPPEFTRMYNAYKATGQKWQEVPANISFCMKADETTGAYSIPPWCSALPMLYDIETYKALQETAEEIANYKLLAMRIQLNSDGTPTVDWELAKQYYQHLCNALPPYIGAVISPMEITDYKFERSTGTSDVDTVSRASQQFWQDSGTSSLLFGDSTNATAGGLKLSIKADEQMMHGYMVQAERLINRILKNMSGTIKFRIQFLPMTIFNQDDQIQFYRDAATLGVPGSKAAYAACLYMRQAALPGLDYVERTVMGSDDWFPLVSGYTIGNPYDDGGRPAMDDEDLSAGGERTRGADSNGNV